MHEDLAHLWAEMSIVPTLLIIPPANARLATRQFRVRKRRPQGSMRQRKRNAGRAILN